MATHPKLILGFSDEKSLLGKFKQPIEFIKEEQYGAGEMRINDLKKVPATVLIIANIYEPPKYLLRTIFLAQLVRNLGAKTIVLIAPWIAYGRQDSIDHPAGLVVADTLQRYFDRIITLDAHSPAFIKAFKNKLTNILPTTAKQFIKKHTIDLIIAPDQGAETRSKNIARKLNLPFAVLHKKRLKNKVTTKFNNFKGILTKKNILIVDDIADSGQTLIAATKLLNKKNVSSVYAFVTHSINMQKLQKKLKKHRIHLESMFDHATGNIDDRTLSELVFAVR